MEDRKTMTLPQEWLDEIKKSLDITDLRYAEFVVKENEIYIRKRLKPRLTIAERLANFEGRIESEEVDWGPPVGEEVW